MSNLYTVAECAMENLSTAIDCSSRLLFLGICRGQPYLATKIAYIHRGGEELNGGMFEGGKVQNHSILQL